MYVFNLGHPIFVDYSQKSLDRKDFLQQNPCMQEPFCQAFYFDHGGILLVPGLFQVYQPMKTLPAIANTAWLSGCFRVN